MCATGRIASCNGCRCWQGSDRACSDAGNAFNHCYLSSTFPFAQHRFTCLLSSKNFILRSFQAARRCGIAICIFALDKNPNAVITLRNLIRTEGWGEFVTVVSSDMRLWQAPCQADIMVRRWRYNSFSPSFNNHFRSLNYWDHSATMSLALNVSMAHNAF